MYYYTEFLVEIPRSSGGQTRGKNSYENDCPSPDRSGNPFVAVFATKDWNV